jgi:hypothetical protein
MRNNFINYVYNILEYVFYVLMNILTFHAFFSVISLIDSKGNSTKPKFERNKRIVNIELSDRILHRRELRHRYGSSNKKYINLNGEERVRVLRKKYGCFTINIYAGDKIDLPKPCCIFQISKSVESDVPLINTLVGNPGKNSGYFNLEWNSDQYVYVSLSNEDNNGKYRVKII